MWRTAPTTHHPSLTVSGDEGARQRSPGPDRVPGFGISGSIPPMGTLGAPDLLGMEAADARLIARMSELHIQVVFHPTEEALCGRVMVQDPAPGATLRPGGTVVITVGAPPTVLVPDLRGGEEAEMLAVLQDAGLRPGRRVARRSDSIPEGHIVRTRPRAGSSVPRGTRLTYIVATRRPPRAKHARRHEKRVRARRLPDGSFLSLPLGE